MTALLHANWRGALLAVCAAAALAACATTAPTPKGAPSAAAKPEPAQPAPVAAQMAPIANPPEESRSTVSAKPKSAPETPPVRSADAKPAPAAQSNSAKAASLREVALVELNRGAVSKAVTLLQQASKLDPSNALIRKDLDRALRINQVIAARQ
jgi:hypothetical protein